MVYTMTEGDNLKYLKDRKVYMPYESVEDLPDNVRGTLPPKAQEIYRKAFNSAWESYKDPEDRRGDASREEVSHKVVWSAVKNVYEKGADGTWRKK